MFRRLLDETEIVQIIQDNGGSGGGIAYQNITLTALEATPGASRLSQEFYNITDASPNNYGKIRMLSETQFLVDITGAIINIIP